MNNYTEFFEKMQNEFLSSLKQAQDLNIKTLASMTNLMSSMPSIDTNEASSATLPTPAELVERSFAFTNQMLETRKEYMTKLADLATEAQTQFTQTAKRVAETANS
ncbi:MAG: hypothetical protein M3R51_05125 [Candidatus Eremiobacteraeota bacterium]|nr:hypothetical protein [Candidatus Eremiobacteraeota bacterium]